MTQNLFHIHGVISCALQKGGHTGMYLASAPPRVFGGQGIAYNNLIPATYPIKNGYWIVF